jgi:integrase
MLMPSERVAMRSPEEANLRCCTQSSKTAGIMSLVFDFVDHNELYSIRNPMDKVTIPASEEEHPELRLLSPEEVFALMARLPSPVNIAVLLVAVTGVRISECLGLRWRHVKWGENKIFIEQLAFEVRGSKDKVFIPAVRDSAGATRSTLRLEPRTLAREPCSPLSWCA